MTSSLSLDVFNGGYKPVPGGPGWDDSTPATWPASTATLISGDRDAFLVDALLTTSEGEQLAAWVRNAGRKLRAIFITHGHADHFFGAGPVLDAFPAAQLVACDQQVVDEARGSTIPDTWRFGTPCSPGSSRSPRRYLSRSARRSSSWKATLSCSARSAAPTPARSPRSCTCRRWRRSAPATSSTTTFTCGYGLDAGFATGVAGVP